ncbi:hypothetical protein GGF32_006048 [Allomyces javanicus]|nr:hypothetical protein GGF32_006048 [Allomyces javanicus]
MTAIPAPALTSTDEAILFLEHDLELDSLAGNLRNDPYTVPVDLIDLALHEYRRFLVLKVVHNDGQAVLLSPSAIIDALWHAHIVDTRAYLAMNEQLPFWIHHEPKGAWDADRTNRARRLENTLACYRARWGEPPAAIWDEDRALIFESEGIPITQQRLIWSGKQLEFGRIFSDYGIPNEDVLYLVLRLC